MAECGYGGGTSKLKILATIAVIAGVLFGIRALAISHSSVVAASQTTEYDKIPSDTLKAAREVAAQEQAAKESLQAVAQRATGTDDGNFWEPERLTTEIQASRPKDVIASNEVVTYLMKLGDHIMLKFTFDAERTGWIYHPSESSIYSSPGEVEGKVKKEIAPGYGIVPGEWVRWQRLSGSQAQGVYIELVSLGKHRKER